MSAGLKTQTIWSLEADVQPILDAAERAGIDHNAVVITRDVGRLDYPGFFCRDRRAWIKVLAYMAVRRMEFSVFMCRITVDDPPREIARYRLHPRLEESMIKTLAAIDAAETTYLVELEDMVEAVVQRLVEDGDRETASDNP